MAAIGMKHLVGAPWAAPEQQVDGQLPKYGSGLKIGRAISSDVTLTRNDGEIYADDVLAESEDSITGGTVDMTVAEVLDEVAMVIFGEEKDEENGDIYDSSSASPFIGFGYMREMVYKGASSFHCVWYFKAQLEQANESAQTRGENVAFQTQRMTGKIMGVTLSNGKTRFRARHTFKTSAEGIAWLNKKANYTETAATEQ